MKTCLPMVAALLIGAAGAWADSHHVLPDGSGEFPTIQAAIDAASDGDSVLLGSGVFTGPGNTNLQIIGKTITVTSETDANSCSIDCEGNGRAFTLAAGFVAATIERITIRNGNGAGFDAGKGGGLYCDRGYLFLSNCQIENNTALLTGGGLLISGIAEIIDVAMRGNTSGLGGAVTCDGGTKLTVGSMSRNLYRGGGACPPPSDSPGGGGVRGKGSSQNTLTLDHSDRKRIAQWLGRSDLPLYSSIRNCLFDANRALVNYADFYALFAPGGELVLSNSILWCENDLPQLVLESGISCRVDHCDILGGMSGVLVHAGSSLHWGTGNIAADPLSVDADGPDDDCWTWADNNHHLSRWSPCIDAGDSAYVAAPGETDLDGQPRVVDGNSDGSAILDMGPYERAVTPADVRPTPSATLRLHQNQPNPFNPVTTIRFEVPEDGRVLLCIFDVQGRLIRKLLDCRLDAGPHRVNWDGNDEAGAAQASGCYVARLEAAKEKRTMQMVLVR